MQSFVAYCKEKESDSSMVGFVLISLAQCRMRLIDWYCKFYLYEVF